MKCPTCGYIGYETSNRCRNCGYDFTLANPAAASPPELSMRGHEPEGALTEIDLRDPGTPEAPRRHGGPTAAERQPDLDKVLQNLDRVIGEPASTADLPLFGGAEAADADLAPMVDATTAPRRPLAVRRATPDPARLRPKPVRHQAPAPQPLELPLPDAAEVVGAGRTHAPTPAAAAEPITGAPPVLRALAAALDLFILGVIDVIVVYFTLRMCGLTAAEIASLPPVPLAAFFLLLNGGYLAAFTAAGGQTIGKMAFGLKVVGHAEMPVSGGLAVVRALGCVASVASLGLGFLPALLADGGRAIEDRLADTRVVRVPAA
jgi:uncharacterized RDD family membrane protein YckC